MAVEPAGKPGSIDPTTRTPFEADLLSQLRRAEIAAEVYRAILFARGWKRSALDRRVAERLATLKAEARSL